MNHHPHKTKRGTFYVHKSNLFNFNYQKEEEEEADHKHGFPRGCPKEAASDTKK